MFLVAGASDEADEGAAGEEQDERVSQEPRNRLLEERPAQARGELVSLSSAVTVVMCFRVFMLTC